MKTGLFLGSFAWLGIFAAAGHAWAMAGLVVSTLGLAAYVVAVVLSGGES